MSKKINYIVVCFLGERRNKTVQDPTTFMRKHLEYLRDNKVDLARVTVVLNTEEAEEAFTTIDLVNEYRPYYTDLRLVIRENTGFSYAGWSQVINSCIENDEKFTHYFLIEDDYLPGRPDFIDFMGKFMNEDVAYVCQGLSGGPLQTTSIDGKNHISVEDILNLLRFSNALYGASSWSGAAQGEDIKNQQQSKQYAKMSIGLLRGDLAEQAYRKWGSALLTTPTEGYTAELLPLQIHFLDFITEPGHLSHLGYKIVDAGDEVSRPFLHYKVKDPSSSKDESISDRGWFVLEWGNPDKQALIEPIIDPEMRAE